METERNEHGEEEQPENALLDRQAREERAEPHRGFVREMDQKMSKAYGMGGLAVVGVLLFIGTLGFFFQMLFHPILWIFGATAALGTLFLARKRIYALRKKLKAQVESYCDLNELSPTFLVEYFEELELYPFFAAIFEEVPGLSKREPEALHQ